MIVRRSMAVLVAGVLVANNALAQDDDPAQSRFGPPPLVEADRLPDASRFGTSDESPPPSANGPAPWRFGEGETEPSAPARSATDGGSPEPSRFAEPAPDAAYGAYQRGLYVTARNLALPRAEAGDPAAQTLLAEIYSRGLGVAVDEAEAEKWYAAAAEQGVPEAQFQYALILLRDDRQSEPARRMMQAAADAGNAMAMFNHAQILLTDRPGSAGQSAAYDYFLAAARQGIADAQYAVAQYHLLGSPPVTVDEDEARGWLEQAARGGFDTAQFELGGMLLEGIGGPRDLQAGFGWTARAARTGNIAAQAQLAKLYWGGIGIEPDDIEAAGWYVLARRSGLRDPVLEDFWLGLSDEARQQAIERANRLRSS